MTHTLSNAALAYLATHLFACLPTGTSITPFTPETYQARYRVDCSRISEDARDVDAALLRPGVPGGALGKAAIQNAIEHNIEDVRSCYRRALQAWPSIAGKVSITFVILPTGKVDIVAVHDNETGVPEIGCCVAAAVWRWEFPKPKGAGVVVVTYPFSLETAVPAATELSN